MLIRCICLFFIVFIGVAYPQELLIEHQPILANNSLAGSFGELRKNHFHAGIDLKTHRKEGYNVYAVNDGYVSRIKHSEYGYGWAIYINHPQGYTTVYAHLKSFSEKIDTVWMKKVFELERYYGDYFFKPNEIPVSTGEVIALSGNSGSSSAPHLHFEVRTLEDERPLNPIHYGLQLEDHIEPLLKGLKLQTQDPKGIDGIRSERKYALKNIQKGEYQLVGSPLKINGPFQLAIHARDQWDGSYNWCGVNLLSLCIDDSICFSMNIDTLDFYHGKFIHSCMDYDEFYDGGRHYLKLFKEKNNPLPFNFQGHQVNQEWLSLTGVHQISIIIGDASGNTSQLSFEAQFSNNFSVENVPLNDCLKDFVRSSDSFKLHIPAGTFPSDFELEFKLTNSQMDLFLSPIFTVNSDQIWMDSSWIYLKAKKQSDKAIWVKIAPDGSKTYHAPAIYREGYYQMQFFGDGKYAIIEDVDAPTIESHWISKSGKWCFKVAEERSTVNEPKVYLNGKWTPCRYYKSGDFYAFERNNGEAIKIVLKDAVGNKFEGLY